MPSIKNFVTQTIEVCKCLKYKKTETPYISKIYKYIHIFKEKKFNFVVDFTSMFSCFRIAGSLFLLRVLI